MIGRKEQQKKNIKRLAVGSTVAAVAGYLAGILTAPKSGQQTRADIKTATSDTFAAAEKDLKKLHTELNTIITDAKQSGDVLSKKAQAELDELLDKASDTKEKARELITVIHEGGVTDDKDLKQAIKDANSAIDKIRDYLKK